MPLYIWNCAQCGDIEVMRPVAEHRCPPQHEHPVTRVITASSVMPDIKPYRAVTGDKMGQMIGGRREHREFLKRNRLVEVGDAPVRPTREFRKTTNRREIVESLRSAIAQHTVPDFKRGGLKERHG